MSGDSDFHVLYFKVKSVANVNCVGLRREPESQWFLHSPGAAHAISNQASGDWANGTQAPSACLHANFLCHSTCVLKALFSRQIRNTCLILRKPSHCWGSHRAILRRRTLGESAYKPDSSPPCPVLPSSSQQLLILNKMIQDQRQLSMARN